MKLLNPLRYLFRPVVYEKPQALSRSFKANSQNSKILEAYERGERMTALRAFAMTNATSSTRRLHEVNGRLRMQGRDLQSRWVKPKGGAKYKEFWLGDPKCERRKKPRK